MDAAQLDNVETAPAIELRQLSVARDSAMAGWNIGWRIDNRSGGPLKILSVHLPHGQFKSAEHTFEPELYLGHADSAEFVTLVRCEAPQGLVTENAFLIFHVLWSERLWRMFVRVRVVVQSRREPLAEVELITTQKVGFSVHGE